MTIIGTGVLAFFLFLVGLPLAGFLITLVLRVVLPYLLGPAAIAFVLTRFLGWAEALWAVCLLGVAWAILLWLMRPAARRGTSALAWHEGHYRAMLRALSLGRTFRSKANVKGVSIPA